MDEISRHYVNAIVDFMYSGRVNAERKHFPALRTAAALMQTPQLMRILTEEIDLTRAHLHYYEAVTGTDLDNKGEHLDDCSSTGNDDGNLLESEGKACGPSLMHHVYFNRCSRYQVFSSCFAMSFSQRVQRTTG